MKSIEFISDIDNIEERLERFCKRNKLVFFKRKLYSPVWVEENIYYSNNPINDFKIFYNLNLDNSDSLMGDIIVQRKGLFINIKSSIFYNFLGENCEIDSLENNIWNVIESSLLANAFYPFLFDNYKYKLETGHKDIDYTINELIKVSDFEGFNREDALRLSMLEFEDDIKYMKDVEVKILKRLNRLLKKKI